jgi:glucose/mannose-6-phosphate isomerase
MYRKSLDPENMYNAIYSFPNQMEKAIFIGNNIVLSRGYYECKNIVVAGMGGSAVGGDLLSLIFNNYLSIPLVVSRNYDLPNWVDEHTLVICSSYSGNTEETLSAFRIAHSKNARIIGITTGGKLSSLLKENQYDEINIPDGFQPRAAVGFSLIPMLYLLKNILKLNIDLDAILTYSKNSLLNVRNLYSQEIPENPVYTLAKQIFKKCIIIYSETGKTDKLAVRLKGQFCENSKMLAFVNELPEMNHNEIVGWENNESIFKKFCILWIIDKDGHNKNQKRMTISQSILQELPVQQFKIILEGKSEIEKIIHNIFFGDWLSYWCAILHKTNPTPVQKIHYLKQALD